MTFGEGNNFLQLGKFLADSAACSSRPISEILGICGICSIAVNGPAFAFAFDESIWPTKAAVDHSPLGN
jgi:hypothetical protein